MPREISMPPRKRQRTIDEPKSTKYIYVTEYQKILNMFNNESQVFEIIVVHMYLRRELEQLLEKEQILQQYLQIETIKIVIPFNDIYQ